jgi:hypothetical protein
MSEPAPIITDTQRNEAGRLIGEAIEFHEKIKAAGQSMFEHVISAGKKLLEAKAIYKDDEAGKRQWGKRLAECWKTSGRTTRTAYRYMDIAQHEALVRADFDTRVKNGETEMTWSIRSALDLIAKHKYEQSGRKPPTKANSNGNTAPKSARASADLATLFRNSDVDEVKGSLDAAKWEADKRAKLTQELMKDLDVDGILDAIKGAKKSSADLREITRGLALIIGQMPDDPGRIAA